MGIIKKFQLRIKVNIYHSKKWNVFVKSFWLWTFIFMHLSVNLVAFLYIPESNLIKYLIFANICLTPISLMGLLIHFNYYRWSKNSTLTIKYDSIRLQNRFSDITLNNSDITHIEHHTCTSLGNFSLWWNFGWFELTDKNGDNIRLNSYLITLDQFWLDNLTRKVSSKNIEKSKSIYPLMK